MRVLDGDTIVLQSNLGPRVIRLIGIDAPEMFHPEHGREPFASQAEGFVRRLLGDESRVWVELDLEVEDAYGRLLAYVYLEDDDGDWSIGDSRAIMVNLAIADAGFADVMTIEPNSLYADLFQEAVASAQAHQRGLWVADATDSDGVRARSNTAQDTGDELPPGKIVIACTLFDPATPNDANAETVTVTLRETLDTRGYYLHDEGSGTLLRLPVGEHGPGRLIITNPGQGIWNNSGDTIYLMFADETVDQWDYTRQRKDEGIEICRTDP